MDHNCLRFYRVRGCIYKPTRSFYLAAILCPTPIIKSKIYDYHCWYKWLICLISFETSVRRYKSIVTPSTLNFYYKEKRFKFIVEHNYLLTNLGMLFVNKVFTQALRVIIFIGLAWVFNIFLSTNYVSQTLAIIKKNIYILFINLIDINLKYVWENIISKHSYYCLFLNYQPLIIILMR